MGKRGPRGWVVVKHTGQAALGALLHALTPPACPPALTRPLSHPMTPSPRCLHPLLRSRTDRRIYCAACRMYAVYEGGAATAAAGSVAGQAAQQQQQQQPEAHQPQAGRGSVRQAAPAPAPAPAAPSAAPSILAASDGLVPSAPTLGRHLPAVDTAADAVAARLADATSALRAAPPGNAGTAVAAVQQCAAALQALAECHRALAALRC